MIPVKLVIEGLYSYQERQEIDFTRLTSAGLFGIFGATGSGKSAVLEAISYAVYGEIERMNVVRRNYNMMNLKSDRMYIAFDFLNHENKLFRATREFRRNSKRFEDVKPSSAVFYENINDEWIPLNHIDGEKVLGLNYNNFKRTIIIPQGHFRSFLELGSKDRTTMMKEIFNLQRFDLQDKAGLLRKNTKTQLDILEGELKVYEEVTQEILDEKKKTLDEESKALEVLSKNHENLNKSFLEYEQKWKDYQVLQEDLKKLATYKKQEPQIKSDEEKLKLYEKAFRVFHSLFNKENDLLIRQKKSNSELDTIKEKLLKVDSDLKKEIEKFGQLKPQYEDLDNRKQKVTDYENLIKLNELTREIDNAGTRMENGEELTKTAEKDEKDLLAEQETIQNKIKNLQEGRIDSGLLLEIAQWYQTKENLEKQLKDKREEAGEYEQKVKAIDKEIEDLKIKPQSFLSDQESERKKLEQERKKLENSLSQLNIEQHMTEYAHALHDGEPCPLCGSEEHPNIVTGKDVSGEIAKIKNLIQENSDKQNKHTDFRTKGERLLDNLKIHREAYEDRLKESKKQEEQIKLHFEEFKWSDFDPKNSSGFETKKAQSLDLEKQINEQEKNLNQTRDNLQKTQNNLKKFKDLYEEIKQSKLRYQTEFKTIQSNLKILKHSDFEYIEKDKLSFTLSQLKSENLQIEKDFKETETKINRLQNEKSGYTASQKSAQRQLEEIGNELDKTSTEIRNKLEENSFTDSEEVRRILAEQMDVENLQKKIEEFKIQFETLKDKVKIAKEKLGDFEGKEEDFQKKKEEFIASRDALKAANDQLSRLDQDYKRLAGNLKKKEELLDSQTKLQKRHDNLTNIYNLLSGSGFVEYIAQIYLRQLCDHANIRFRRMTRNQLSLHFSDNNDFEVRDYLNEGRIRSVRTLSGGQSFQAALSLALALAESVQSHNQSKQNFFFIDEGFGTQDVESVNIVFDTLTQLQKENRIVGIISHVDELKERIPVALQITKDEEKGSRIEEV